MGGRPKDRVWTARGRSKLSHGPPTHPSWETAWTSSVRTSPGGDEDAEGFPDLMEFKHETI